MPNSEKGWVPSRAAPPVVGVPALAMSILHTTWDSEPLESVPLLCGAAGGRSVRASCWIASADRRMQRPTRLTPSGRTRAARCCMQRLSEMRAAGLPRLPMPTSHGRCNRRHDCPRMAGTRPRLSTAAPRSRCAAAAVRSRAYGALACCMLHAAPWVCEVARWNVAASVFVSCHRDRYPRGVHRGYLSLCCMLQ